MNEITINNENCNRYVIDSILSLNQAISTLDKTKPLKIYLKDINEAKSLNLILTDFHFPLLQLEIRNCTFGNFFCQCTLDRIWIRNSVFGKNETDKIIFDDFTCYDLDIYNSEFHKDITIRKLSTLDRLGIDSSPQIKSLSILNSLISEARINQVKTDAIFSTDCIINKFDLEHTEIVDSVNLFSNEIEYLRLANTNYSNRNISKTNIFNNSNFNSKNLKEIEITDSIFPFNFMIDSETLEKVFIYRSSFKSLFVDYFNANVKVLENEINGHCKIGSKGRGRVVEELVIEENLIDKDLVIGCHAVVKEFTLGLNQIKNGKTYINSVQLDVNCDSNLEKAEFENTKFYKCFLENFSFKGSNAYKAKFEFCRWKEIEFEKVSKRIAFKSDKINPCSNISDLKELKELYSNFRKHFEQSNNNIDASKFKISEQLVRLEILKRENKNFQNKILRMHKFLSHFGESIYRPLMLLITSSLFFALLYFFCGFTKYDNSINYELALNFENWKATLVDIGNAIILSFKNIVPIKLNSNFFLDFGIKQNISQLLSFFQKVLNLIILGSLIGAIRNFMKK